MAILYEIISQPQGAHCKIKGLLRNGPSSTKLFRSPIAIPCENFRSYETHLWHTSAILQPMPPFRSPSPISQLRKPLRNPPLAHECHFVAPPPHFAAAKMAIGWENGTSLQNALSSTKNSNRHLASNLNFLNSIFHFKPVICLAKTSIWCEIEAKPEHHFQKTSI